MLDQHMTGLATWQKPDGGFFMGVNLKADVQAETLLKRADQAGLQLSDGRNFFVENSGDRFVRLPFCAVTPDEIEEGIVRLAKVVSTY